MLGVFDSFVQINTMFKVGLYMQQLGLTSGIRYIMLDDDYFSPKLRRILTKSILSQLVLS